MIGLNAYFPQSVSHLCTNTESSIVHVNRIDVGLVYYTYLHPISDLPNYHVHKTKSVSDVKIPFPCRPGCAASCLHGLWVSHT